MPKKSDTTPEQRAALEERVKAGEWLRINDAAQVLGISRTKVDTLMRRGTIGYRNEPGSRYRQCNPADIKKLLAESRQELRGDTSAVPSTHGATSPRTVAAPSSRVDPETAPTEEGKGTHRR